MADCGVSSRRHADRMIEEGQVTVNGKKVYELGAKVDPQNDKVLVNGKLIKKFSQKLYVIFNKPRGVLTSMEDPLNRPTVADFLEKVPARVFPVGRLDWDSEGLLILTNDGDYAHKITHPKEEVTKTYLVKVDGQPEPRHLQKLRDGVSIVGGKVSAKHVEKIKRTEGSDKYDWYKIVITEGKNRQIRQMFEKIGFDVLKLQRVAIGRLRLGALGRGEVAFLADNAINTVFLPDLPDEVKAMKAFKAKQPSKKRTPSTNAAKKAKKIARAGTAKPAVEKKTAAKTKK